MSIEHQELEKAIEYLKQHPKPTYHEGSLDKQFIDRTLPELKAESKGTTPLADYSFVKGFLEGIRASRIKG